MCVLAVLRPCNAVEIRRQFRKLIGNLLAGNGLAMPRGNRYGPERRQLAYRLSRRTSQSGV